MKIIKDFPIIKVNDIITFIDNQNDLVNMEVKGTWYPKKDDIWTETKEWDKMGYGNSNPEESFPQLTGIVKEKGRATIFGNDKNNIKTINGIKT